MRLTSVLHFKYDRSMIITMYDLGKSFQQSDNHDFSGLANNLWRHGGPTAAFVHLCTAMCFLLPSLLMEARLIHAGFLPKGNINVSTLLFVMLLRNEVKKERKMFSPRYYTEEIINFAFNFLIPFCQIKVNLAII